MEPRERIFRPVHAKVFISPEYTGIWGATPDNPKPIRHFERDQEDVLSNWFFGQVREGRGRIHTGMPGPLTADLYVYREGHEGLGIVIGFERRDQPEVVRVGDRIEWPYERRLTILYQLFQVEYELPGEIDEVLRGFGYERV